jgi:phospholipid/cholesterol/gamma-HCH transport system substrate-binding protein
MPQPLPVPQASFWDKIKYKIYALVLIAIIVGAAGISAAAYNHAFTSSIPVSLQAGRAGLQMHPGNRVKIRGVDLGLVRSVDLNPDQNGVTIVMNLDPELAGEVPVNVNASLDQLTAFGNKTVQLQYPDNPSPQTLRAHSVIAADHVAGEINSTFDHLMTVINNIQPAKLNATLGAFAQTLQGRGDSIGTTLTKADRYLAKFNGNLPALQNDFRVTAGFANVYADAAPDIVKLFSNAGVTSETIADGDFPGLLDGLRHIGGEADDFFAENADPLTDMLDSLRPTTSLLHEYSPALTCFLEGAAVTYHQLNKTGFNESGVQFEATLSQATPMYQYPRDLPKVGPGAIPGPNCRGLPVVGTHQQNVADPVVDPPGARSPGNTPQVSREPAVVQMFGPRALLPPALTGGH